jgi:hypothetical protein
MDPLSAIGLVGNICQFVDFGSKLISEARQAYKSAAGASRENIELESITKDLSELAQKLVMDSTSDLGRIAGMCKDVADELLQTVQKLKVTPGSCRKWQSFVHAVEVVWGKRKINELQERMSRLRSELMAQLLRILWYDSFQYGETVSLLFIITIPYS